MLTLQKLLDAKKLLDSPVSPEPEYYIGHINPSHTNTRKKRKALQRFAKAQGFKIVETQKLPVLTPSTE